MESNLDDFEDAEDDPLESAIETKSEKNLNLILFIFDKQIKFLQVTRRLKYILMMVALLRR